MIMRAIFCSRGSLSSKVSARSLLAAHSRRPCGSRSIPTPWRKYGIGLEDVRAALASANANSPKGTIDDNGRQFQIYTNDQATRAADYTPLIIAYRNGAPVHLTDVAEVLDSVEDVRNLALAEGRPAVIVVIFRQPGANIIDTVDRVRAELPH